MLQERQLAPVVQKSSSSKAAAILTRGAYIEYVSTAKWRQCLASRFGKARERRWRLFSTFPHKLKRVGFRIEANMKY